MSNDLEHTKNTDSTKWLLNGGKEMVEQRTCAINIQELKREWQWQHRNALPLYNQHPFTLGKVKFKLIRDTMHGDWNIQIAEPGPKCGETIIDIVRTPCHYGGSREWFICQKCYRRAGILYRDNDMFGCRKCLNLVYYCQKQNYYSLEPAIRHMHKVEKMIDDDHSGINKFYKGKPTKKTISFEKLQEKALGEFDYYGAKLKNKDKDL